MLVVYMVGQDKEGFYGFGFKDSEVSNQGGDTI